MNECQPQDSWSKCREPHSTRVFMWPRIYYVDSRNWRRNSHKCNGKLRTWAPSGHNCNDKLRTWAPPSPRYRRRKVLAVNEGRAQPEDSHVARRLETRSTWRNPRVDCCNPYPAFPLNIEQRDKFKEAINTGKALNSKAVICIWPTVNKQTEERQTSQITEWITELRWKATTWQIRNEQHDGYLEGRSTFLIAASRRIINRLPEQFQESNDGYHYLEQFMDLGNGIIKDCLSFLTAIDQDSKPSGSGGI